MDTYVVRSLGRRLSALVAVSFVTTLPLIVGCNGYSNTYTPITVTTTPATGAASTTVGTGEALTIAATSSATGGVTWALTGATCTGATCGTLTNSTTTSVLYTAPTSIASSPLTVAVTGTATIAIGPSLSTGTTNITVVPTTVAVTPSNPPTVPPGKTLTLTAAVAYDVNNLGVKWSLSGLTCSGASCGSITQTTTSVTYTAPQGNGLQVSITATSIANPSVSTSVPVSLPIVLSPVALSSGPLPTAIVGQPYSTTIFASSGSAPYVFQEQNLPSWVTLTTTYDSVTLSGTPNAPGTLDAQITVVDSSTPSTETAIGYYPLTTYSAAATNNAMLKGSYAFYGLGSQDGTASNTVATEPSLAYVGSLTADGNGNITGGEVDINSYTGLTTYKGLTGTYNVGPNQLGTVTLIPPIGGVSPITFVVGLSGLNSSNVATQGSFIEYDDSTGIGVALASGSTGVRANGSLALQTASAFSTTATPFTGSYAFGMAGINPGNLQPSTASCQVVTSGKTYYYCGPVSLAGSIIMGAAGAITSGAEDVNQSQETAPLVTLTGAFGNSGNTDASGRVTASITAKNPNTAEPLNAWPSDFIVYAVNPTMFYIMSSDSYASNTLLAGLAMQQNLADIASTPFSATVPIVAYSDTLSSEDFPNNQGALRTEMYLLSATPTSAIAGSMVGTTYANGAGTIGTPAPAAVAKFTYAVTPATGRVKPSVSAVPTMYLVDTGIGFGTNWDPAVTSGVNAGTWIVQQQTSTALNAGTYVMYQPFPNSNTAPLETGSIVIPAGGVSASGTNIPFTGTIYASYSEASTDQSNTLNALLYTEPITGTVTNTAGTIPLTGITTSAGVMVCNNGGGYIISPTSFVCLTGASGIPYAQVYVFQQ